MKKQTSLFVVFCVFLMTFLLTGCGDPLQTPAHSSSFDSSAPGRQESSASSLSAEKETRPPREMLLPEAPEDAGASIIGNEQIALNVTNTAEGYLAARYSGTAAKIKILLYTPDDVKYTYDLTAADTWAFLPLTGGNGTYQIEVYEHVEGTSYSTLFKDPALPVALRDEFRPFLYPNQYTWFTPESETVKKASEMSQASSSDLEFIEKVYEYTIRNITYDEEKAALAKNGELAGYLPNVDQTLASGTGICFDYAALMTAMLRSQSIPTKLEIGYSGEAYHAWISTYIEEIGWVDNVIRFDGDTWTLIDPTLAAGNSAESVKKYIGDGSNYVVKYSR